MQRDQQLDLLGGGPPPAPADDRHDRALAAAEQLAPRLGLQLPAAVQRALDGQPPRSALEGIALHVVRVVDAVAALDGSEAMGQGSDAVVEAIHRRLPAVYGASPGIARGIIAALIGGPVEPQADEQADEQAGGSIEDLAGHSSAVDP